MSWAHVALRPVCEALGLDVHSQRHRLQRQPWTCEVMMTSQMPGDNQSREMTFIDRRTFTMWLATIDTGRLDLSLAGPAAVW
nr:phage antirepressor N-terminal domain-containing protein [uncultured Actinomyces sp.]